jgi:hypothetical protein
LYIGLIFIVGSINDQKLLNKVIAETYKTRIGRNPSDSSLNRSNTGNFVKRFEEFTMFDRFICCKKYISSKHKKYKRGLHKVQKELDFIGHIKVLQKLKAGLSAIIKNDKTLLDETKRLY